MKKTIALLLLCVFILSGCTQPNTNENLSKSSVSADTLFNEFLSKKINAVNKNGDSITLDEYSDNGSKSSYHRYAIYDMNGDGIQELIIKTPYKFDIFWVKNGQVTLWYQGTNYTKPLNNMTLLSERQGAAPDHTDYIFISLNYQGDEAFRMEFSKYASTNFQGVQYNEKYLINNVEVNKEVYSSLTESLVTANDDKIIWYELP